MKQTLVCVHNLLEVKSLVRIMSEGCILEEILIECNDSILILSIVTSNNLCTEDTTGKVTTVRDEIYGYTITLKTPIKSINSTRSRRRTKLVQCLADLMQMLMTEKLIDREVVITPREMGCCSRLLTCSSRTCDSINSNITSQETCLCKWKKTFLNASSKATWVSQMLALGNLLAMSLRQAIYIVVVALYAEVLSKVNDLHI